MFLPRCSPAPGKLGLGSACPSAACALAETRGPILCHPHPRPHTDGPSGRLRRGAQRGACGLLSPTQLLPALLAPPGCRTVPNNGAAWNSSPTGHAAPGHGSGLLSLRRDQSTCPAVGAPCTRTDPPSPGQFSQVFPNSTCRRRAGGLQGPAGPSVSTALAPQLVVHEGGESTGREDLTRNHMAEPQTTCWGQGRAPGGGSAAGLLTRIAALGADSQGCRETQLCVRAWCGRRGSPCSRAASSTPRRAWLPSRTLLSGGGRRGGGQPGEAGPWF